MVKLTEDQQNFLTAVQRKGFRKTEHLRVLNDEDVYYHHLSMYIPLNYEFNIKKNTLKKDVNLKDFIISFRIEWRNDLHRFNEDHTIRVQVNNINMENFHEQIWKIILNHIKPKTEYDIFTIGSVSITIHKTRTKDYKTLIIKEFKYNYQYGTLVYDNNCLASVLGKTLGINITEELTCEKAITIATKNNYPIRIDFEFGHTLTNILNSHLHILSNNTYYNKKKPLNLTVVENHIEITKLSTFSEWKKIPHLDLISHINNGIIPIDVKSKCGEIMGFRINEIYYSKEDQDEDIVMANIRKSFNKKYPNAKSSFAPNFPIGDINIAGIHKTLKNTTNCNYADLIQSFKTIGLTEKFPVYEPYNEVIQCNEVSEDGLYYAISDTSTSRLFNVFSGDYYPHFLIKLFNLKVSKKFIPHRWISIKNFVEDTSKIHYSKFIGCCNLSSYSRENGKIMNHIPEDATRLSIVGIDKDDITWYYIYNVNVQHSNENLRMFYLYTYYYQTRNLYNMSKDIGFTHIVEFRADAVLYTGNRIKNTKKYKHKENEDTRNNADNYIPRIWSNYKSPELTELSIHEALCLKQGFDLRGGGGSGKTYHINNTIIPYLKANNISYVVCSTTCNSASLINGITINALLFKDGKIGNCINNTIQCVIIDEISMMSLECFRALLNIKRNNHDIMFIFVGDCDNQLPAINEGHKPWDNYKCNFYQFLTDFNCVKLTTNKRCNLPLEISNYSNFQFEGSEEITLINLAYTNKKCDEINIKVEDFHIKKVKQKKDENGIFKYKKLICLNKNSDLNYYKSEIYFVKDITNNSYIIKNNMKEIKIPKINIKDFNSGYCITIHKAQGLTINEVYTIHEYDIIKKDDRLNYVALSRRTTSKVIVI